MKSAPKLRILLVLITLVLAGSGAALLLTKIARAGQYESPPPSGIDRGLKVIESNEQNLILEYTTPGYQIQTVTLNGEGCQLLEVEGFGATDQVGWPQIPIKGFLIGIPSGETPTIEILQAEAVVTPETYDLCPVGKPRVADSLNGELRYPGMEYLKDPDGYQANHFFPETLVELGETGYIRSQRVAQLRLQPFQYNPVSGELRYYVNIRVRVNFNVGTEDVRTLDQNFVDEGPFEALLRDSLVNYQPAQGWRAAPQASLPLIQESSLYTLWHAYKILVDQDGIFQISYADLQAAGVPVDEIDPRTLKIHNQGLETAIYVSGEEDATFAEGEYLLFYGQKFHSKYTDTNVYWLTWGFADGKRMPIIDGAPSGSTNTPAHFQTNLHLEEDHVYQSSRPSGAQNDHWYWDVLLTSSSTQKTYTFTLENLSTLPVSTTIGGLFYSYYTNSQHHTIVTINGHLVDDAYWPNGTEYSFNNPDVSQEYLHEGENEITVEAPLEGGISNQMLFINWFEVVYFDTYAAENDILWFDGELLGDQIFELSGFSDPDIDQDDVLFDVTDPYSPTRIISATVELIGSDYHLSFEQNIVNERHYLALSPSRRLTPSGIIRDSPSDLHDQSNGADYIIITHQDFYADVLPLADQRASQGLRVEVVKLQDVFDEFSDGIYDPEAIRSFLGYAYANWASPAPAYVLLVGDGNYDFKGNYGWGESNYIPPYLLDVDPWMGETASDNRYVCVNGPADILPDMNIGRLPVKTSLETQDMVAKILDYEANTSTEEWDRKVLFVADNADSAGDFAAYSDAVADHYLPEPYQADKIYYGENFTDPAETQTAIVNAINGGRLMVSYVGHSTPYQWAFSPTLLHKDQVDTLTNSGKLAFFVPMTCYDGYFIFPSSTASDNSSIGEVVARAPDKGAIASWSPTGLGVANGHDILEKGLFEAIFYDDVTQIGPATTQAKFHLYANSMAYRELIDTYLLFGDPYTILQVAINTTIIGTPDDPSSSADASFTFNSSKPGSTFECRLDGGAYAACDSPKNYTGLSNGSHTFYVRAIDAAGNPDPTPASYTWEIDTPAPQNIYIYWPLVFK